MAENWISVAAAAEIGPGEMKGVEAAGAEIAIYNLEGAFYATSNICTHAFTYLTGGFLDGELIECPLHAGQFDIRTGKGQGAPITRDLQTYKVRLNDGMVEVSVT